MSAEIDELEQLFFELSGSLNQPAETEVFLLRKHIVATAAAGLAVTEGTVAITVAIVALTSALNQQSADLIVALNEIRDGLPGMPP